MWLAIRMPLGLRMINNHDIFGSNAANQRRLKIMIMIHTWLHEFSFFEQRAGDLS